MNEHSLDENFECEGIWWLPENPHMQVPGIVSSSGTEITLKLFGLLKDPEDLNYGELFAPDIILGRSQGKRITLCPTFATEYPSSGISTQILPQYRHLARSSFLITHMLIGAHFQTMSEIKFSALSLSFTDLEEWMGWGNFPFKEEYEDDSYTVRYACEDPVRAQVREIGTEILVGWNLTRKMSHRGLNWERKAVVRVNPERSQSIEWYLNVLHELRYLFALLVGRPVYVLGVTVHLAGEYGTVRDGELVGPVKMFSFEHLYDLRKHQPWPASWSMRNVLVPLPSIQEDFGRIVNKWFDRAKVLRPVLNTFINSLERTGTIEESKFLVLTQALEIYHRRTFPTVQRKLSLKERLEQLLESVSIIRNYTLKEAEKPYHFAQKVADTRHYLVHGDEKKEQKAYKNHEYADANQRLQVLFIALMLLDLQGEYEIVLNAVEKFASTYFVREG